MILMLETSEVAVSLCMQNEGNMKTQAQEIKAGQTIKFGNEWGIAQEDAKQSDKKSNEVDVIVVTLPGTVKRRGMGFSCNHKSEGGIKTFYSYRKETMVPTK